MSTKNKWLIKSDYKILGPYSYEQVEDLLMKKQVSLIDEIRDMNIRWSYVREVAEFKHLVGVVRQEQDSKSELTQTLQTSLQRTTTGTVTAEYTKTAAENATYTGVDLPRKPALDPSDIPARYVKSQNKNISEPIVEVSKSTSGVVKFLIFILAVGVGFGFWYYDNNYGQNKADREAVQQIRKNSLYALDNQSVEIFKTLPESTQDKVLVEMISLWPKLEAAGLLSANRILDLTSKGKIVGNEKKSQYQLYKFNKSLAVGDTENAKDALVKAMDLEPSSLDAKVNDAVLYFIQKKYSEAAKAYKNLYSQSPSGEFLFGYALSKIKEQKIQAEAQEIYQIIETHVAQRADYNKELMFLQMYLLKKYMNFNAEVFTQHYKAFVEYPHQMKRYFYRSSLRSNEVNSWDNLAVEIKEILNGLDEKSATMIELQLALEGDSLEKFSNSYQKNILNLSENDKYNLQAAYYFLKQSYQDVVQLQLTDKVNALFLSSQIYLLLSHADLKSHSTIQMRYVNLLMKDRLLFSNWAQLVMTKFPEDREQIKALIQSDKIYADTFLPYLKYRALLND